MNKRIAIVLAAGFLLLPSSTAVLAQRSKAAEIKRIDRYVRSIDRLTNRSKGPDLVFADTAGSDDKTTSWRRFASTKELEKFRETKETYTVAYNWRSNGRIVAANFTLFSESGDWAKYVDHYFRADGTLAKVRSELRTFYGDYIVIRDIYFDTKGRRIKRTMKYLDLTTKKPKKPTADFLADNSMASEVDYFKRTNLLPFAKLLKTR